MASLGANVTIPDQVVLVGGTGRPLSERFSLISDGMDSADLNGRFTVRLSNGRNDQKNTIQDRLGPRRFTGNDMQQDNMYQYPNNGRPHVLKRLGQTGGSPYGSPWQQQSDTSNAYNVGQVGRGRGGRGGRYSYGNYYGGGSSFNRYPNKFSSYGSYYNGGYQPYSYYNYSRPRFSNYSYYSPYSFRGYNYNRGRNNNYASRFASRSRRGRFGRTGSRPQVSQEDLDREMDEYRQAGDKKDRGGDVAMS